MLKLFIDLSIYIKNYIKTNKHLRLKSFASLDNYYPRPPTNVSAS